MQTTCWEERLLGPGFPYMSKVTVCVWRTYLSGRIQNACAIAYAATLGDDDDAHSGPQKCTAPSLHQTTHPFPHPLPQLPKLTLGMMSIGLATVTINIEVRGCRGLSSLVANWFVCPLSLLWFVYWSVPFYGRGGSISSRTSLSIRRHVRRICFSF